jgi:hypothetical protein
MSSAACYYCVLKNSSPDTSGDSSDESKPSSRKFVICFVSFFDSSLDLYPFKCHVMTGNGAKLEKLLIDGFFPGE